jgi:hypothetical protein
MVIKLIKKKYIFFIIFVAFASYSNFFINIYSLYKRDYEERLIRAYGNCNGISYGYIKKIYNNFLLKDRKIYILNFEIYPESYGLFPYLKKDYEINNLILLNYKKNNETQLKKMKIDLKNYKMVDKEDKCYFYKKSKKND